jgi:hypothetical protein
MDVAVVSSTQRNRKFVADLASHRARLSEPQMVSVRTHRPHDFAVRISIARLARCSVHRIPTTLDYANAIDAGLISIIATNTRELGWGRTMTTLQAVMFGIMLALTPSLVTLAFFLYRDGVMTRNEGAIRPEPPDWSLHC